MGLFSRERDHWHRAITHIYVRENPHPQANTEAWFMRCDQTAFRGTGFMVRFPLEEFYWTEQMQSSLRSAAM